MIYVLIQFGCIIYLVFNAQILHVSSIVSLISMALIIFSGILGLLAVVHMSPDNLNIVPSLKKNHRLITSGIYRFIRHPMYSSVLLFCTGLLLSHPTLASGIVLAILLLDLVLKANLEERLLTQRFSEYSAYQQTSGKFLPFL